MDIKPVIRTNVDGVFILRETNLRNRKSLWENYAGIIPDFSTFCTILDELTSSYSALYIHNQNQSNRMEDCIFWYKAKPVPPEFKLGSKDFWKFHYNRYDSNYTDPFVWSVVTKKIRQKIINNAIQSKKELSIAWKRHMASSRVFIFIIFSYKIHRINFFSTMCRHVIQFFVRNP